MKDGASGRTRVAQQREYLLAHDGVEPGGRLVEDQKCWIALPRAHQADLLQLLRQGSIDLALTYDLQLQSDIDFIPLASLPPYVLLAAGDPMSIAKEIAIEDLADRPMILLDLPLSSEYFMGIFSNRKIKPTIKARTRLTDVQRGLALLKSTRKSQARIAFIDYCKSLVSDNCIPGMTTGFD